MFKSHKDKSFFVSDQVTQTSMFASPYRFYSTENVGSASSSPRVSVVNDYEDKQFLKILNYF